MERKIIASTFDGKATVFTRDGQMIYENIPCALSRTRTGERHGNQPITQGLAPKLNYQTKLFVLPDVDIPAGSFLLVNQYGREVNFISSGEPIKYKSHSEILIEREDYA